MLENKGITTTRHEIDNKKAARACGVELNRGRVKRAYSSGSDASDERKEDQGEGRFSVLRMTAYRPAFFSVVFVVFVFIFSKQ